MFGFTRTIALELAQGGSTANCVAPGFTATDMLESVPDEVLDRIIAGIPLARLGRCRGHRGRRSVSRQRGLLVRDGEVIDVNGGMDL